MTALAAPAAHPAQDWWRQLAARSGHTAAALLQAEASAGRRLSSVYELFAEMEEKDGHLYAVLQTRLNGLLGLRRQAIPAQDTPAAARVAGFVQQALDSIPRFDELLRALLDGIARGFAVVEVLWDYDAAGRLVPADWIAHPQEAFLFDDRGGLLLLSPPFSGRASTAPPDTAPGRSLWVARGTVAPPPRKFITLVFSRDARNPYGRGLAQRAYWYYWFKKNNLKFWAIHNEKFGAPTAVATCAPGVSAEERARLLEVLDALQTDSGVVIPETVTLRLLESARGGAAAFRDMADWCNDEMSKIVLGATLTSGEGRRSGSLALGTIHDAVRHDYIRSDARLLEGAVNGTLVRWITELNFGAAAQPPRWTIDAEPPEDLEGQLRLDRELVALGVPLPRAHFHERYRRRPPRPGEPALTHDDTNLFHYHLRYGVLTVNEVRARLGFPPVPWGNRPTADGASAASRAEPEDRLAAEAPDRRSEDDPRER